jgi:hypothetical protein
MPSTVIGQIGAVVEIEAAQKILIGFAFAGMLGHDQSRHRFEQFADPRGRTRVQLLAADMYIAGGGRVKAGRFGRSGRLAGRGCSRAPRAARWRRAVSAPFLHCFGGDHGDGRKLARTDPRCLRVRRRRKDGDQRSGEK